ncbi:MAG: hypothetical protein QM601_01260 [Pseudoxanthomonas sp.]
MTNFLDDAPLRRLVWLTLALFLTYLAVAMALPAVAVQVSHGLRLGNVASGLAVGIAGTWHAARAAAGRRLRPADGQRGGVPAQGMRVSPVLPADPRIAVPP